MKSLIIAVFAVLSITPMAFANDRIEEGFGAGGFALDRDIAQLTESVGQAPNWVHWSGMHIDCLMNAQGKAIEIRFNEGFAGATSKGIKIGSTESDVFEAYGAPAHAESKMKGSKKLEYSEEGILFWVNNDRVTQIVVFKAQK